MTSGSSRKGSAALLHLLVANVTAWSPWAQDYFFTNSWDIALLAEVHLHPSTIAQQVRDLLDKRLIPCFSPPVVSPNDDTKT